MAETTDGAAARPESQLLLASVSEQERLEPSVTVPEQEPAGMRRDLLVFAAKLILCGLVMAATTTVFSLFVWTVLPFVSGWSPSVVLTGSMAPQVMPGDIVVTAPIKPEQLALGQVVRFKDPANVHPYVMHRIIKMNDDGTLITQGDNNRSADSTPVPVRNVVGVARLRVPMIGLPALWVRNGDYLPLALMLIIVFGSARVLTGMRSMVSRGMVIDMPDDEPAGWPAAPADGSTAALLAGCPSTTVDQTGPPDTAVSSLESNGTALPGSVPGP